MKRRKTKRKPRIKTISYSDLSGKELMKLIFDHKCRGRRFSTIKLDLEEIQFKTFNVKIYMPQKLVKR